MSTLPSFQEDHISQIPALHLLQNMGYVYLRPQEVFLERKGKLSNVILEGVLEKQLRKLNRIRFKGAEDEFSDANINAAIQALKDFLYDGLIRTNERVYDLISLGKSFEQTIAGDTKSFTLRYFDWEHPENNVFHVTFKTVKHKMDEEAYEQFLADEAVRQRFYEKLSAYSRTLGVALSTVKFVNETPETKLERYKKDLAFFMKLRVSMKKRYAEEIDYKEYEAKVQKLIDTHVAANEVLPITPPVNIFEQEQFQAEIDKLQTTASRADTIAHRTQKTITEKMEEDPFFYRRFSKILADAIEAYRLQRISDAEYLNKVTEVMNSVRGRTGDDLPPELRNREVAKAFFGVVRDVMNRKDVPQERAAGLAAQAALEIDEVVRKNRVVDWTLNMDVQNAMRNGIDDYLYTLREKEQIELTFDDMDLIVENALHIAKARYA